MRINREELLKQLESVLPGLSTREIIEQSSCFIFKIQEGRGYREATVNTYNDEIACSQKSLLKIEGAVQAIPFISILRKLKEEELEIDVNDKNTQLLIKGKHRRAGIRMEQDIVLQIEAVDKPKKWKDLPADFADAIAIVQPCAGSNETQFVMTCIHITPKWMEACDNHQVTRFKIKTDIVKPVLIRKESLKYIVSLDMTEFSETKHWIHFRNPTGLIFSCRHFIEKYPTNDITKILKVSGEPLVLPKGLKDAIEKAEIFSSENVEGSDVFVNLKPGKFKITGKGASGWFSEIKKSKYNGESLQFTIPAKLLLEVVQQYDKYKCKVSPNYLKITGKKFAYVTALGTVEEKEA